VDFKEMERRIKADNDARSGSSLCRSLGDEAKEDMELILKRAFVQRDQ
jgi:hypothetical protein